MSNYCPCCDDFSIDASRARRLPMKKKKIEKFSVDKKAKKIVLNVVAFQMPFYKFIVKSLTPIVIEICI